MLVVHVHVHVKPEMVEAFIKASLENARHSIQEEGVARFDVLQQQDNPERFIHLSNCFIGGTFFGKRKIFLALNGFRNLEYSEDSDLLIRAKGLFNVEKFDFPTYIYHHELSDSLTNSYAPH